jgi:hypothetical protein
MRMKARQPSVMTFNAKIRSSVGARLIEPIADLSARAKCSDVHQSTVGARSKTSATSETLATLATSETFVTVSHPDSDLAVLSETSVPAVRVCEFLVGADLSRPSPIYRPLQALPFGRLPTTTLAVALAGDAPSPRPTTNPKRGHHA